MSQLGQQILQRAKELEDIRRDYETGLWDDIGKFVNPRREDLRAYDHSRLKGRRRGTYAYSDTAQQALSTWADGMQGFLVPESLPWFKSEMSVPQLDRLPEVSQWLQDYDEVMYSAFKGSNFYTAMPLYFRDGGSIGTATMFTEEDIANGTQVYTCIHPREVFIAENRFGQVDTAFRKFEKTARQLQQEFDNNKLPSEVITNAKQPGTASFRYIIWHAVWPNKDGWTPKKGNKEFRSVYVIAKDAASNNAGHSAAVVPGGSDGRLRDVIKEGGFDRNPYAVWRFRKNSDEVYGYSPAADIIRTIFKDNQFGKTLMQRGQLEAEPAANIPEHMRGNVRLGPGGMNYFQNPQDVASYIANPGNFTVGKDREDAIKAFIENAYSVQLFTFLLNSEREKTAFEVDRTESQQAVLIGPQKDQLYKEGIEPLFNTTADIEDEAGRLPPPPPIIEAFREDARRKGKPEPQINIRLVGPLPQAQDRILKLGPIRAGNNELGLMSQIYGPEILDAVNRDEVVRITLDAVHFPQSAINTEEEMDEIRQARAEQLARQQALEQAAAIAEAVPPTKDIEPNSPIAQLAGAV
jgi:hypothetical protein